MPVPVSLRPLRSSRVTTTIGEVRRIMAPRWLGVKVPFRGDSEVWAARQEPSMRASVRMASADGKLVIRICPGCGTHSLGLHNDNLSESVLSTEYLLASFRKTAQ